MRRLQCHRRRGAPVASEGSSSPQSTMADPQPPAAPLPRSGKGPRRHFVGGPPDGLSPCNATPAVHRELPRPSRAPLPLFARPIPGAIDIPRAEQYRALPQHAALKRYHRNASAASLKSRSGRHFLRVSQATPDKPTGAVTGRFRADASLFARSNGGDGAQACRTRPLFATRTASFQ